MSRRYRVLVRVSSILAIYGLSVALAWSMHWTAGVATMVLFPIAFMFYCCLWVASDADRRADRGFTAMLQADPSAYQTRPG